jgi:hypothetical protein
VGTRRAKNDTGRTLEKEEPSTAAHGGARSHPIKLNPALKSWLDNVIIPALVEEYLAEIEQKNRLAITDGSEVRSNKGVEKS